MKFRSGSSRMETVLRAEVPAFPGCIRQGAVSRSRRRAWRVGGLTVALLMATSCDFQSPSAPTPPGDDCDQPGITVGAAVSAPAVWTRAGSPWHLAADVSLSSTLRIEAGALVCGAAGATIVLLPGSSLEVSGTAAEPVRLTARDSTQRWGGIVAPPPSVMSSLPERISVAVRHAVIEYADQGLALSGADAGIDSTVFRQITGNALLSDEATTTLLRGSTIDTTGGVAVRAQRFHSGSLTVEHTVVRGSSGHGIAAYSRGSLVVEAVRIEGSAGTGLFVEGGIAAARADIDVQGAVRITGSGGYPAQVPLEAAVRLITLQPLDSLLGNARDTLRVGHGQESSGTAEVVIPAGLPWDLRTHGIGGTLRLEPGAVVTFGPSIYGWVRVGNGIVAEGRPDAPIIIHGTFNLWPFNEAASRLAHVRLEDVQLHTTDEATLVLEDAHAVRSALHAAGDVSIARLTATDPSGPLNVNTGTLRDITIRGSDASAAQPAVDISGAVTMDRCEITGTRSDAIRVQASGLLHVRNCNLFDNHGLGVRLIGAGRADAILNWWGDPAGPFGPAGDGVSEGVDYIPFLTAPVQ